MSVIAIIPARYGSSRFPGKPLALLHGLPLIQYVYQRTAAASFIDKVVVATDDERIEQVVKSFGGNVLMTSTHHCSGTDRCGEAAQLLCLKPDDIVLNIQGDEPLITSEVVFQLFSLFNNPSVNIASLKCPIFNPDDIQNNNVVKVVSSINSKALYFSRLPIPFCRDGNNRQITYYKHIGVYGYRYSTLLQLIKLSPSSLEECEKLEQLRWLENGFEIYIAACDYEGIGIDTPEDLERCAKLL